MSSAGCGERTGSCGTARDPLKSRGLVRSGDDAIPPEFRFVSAHQAVYPIATLCRVLGVSPSGYCASTKRAPSRRAASDAGLSEHIRAVHAASDGIYGAPRVKVELADVGIAVSRKRIARLMRLAGLAGISRRRFAVTTRRDGGRPAPD